MPPTQLKRQLSSPDMTLLLAAYQMGLIPDHGEMMESLKPKETGDTIAATERQMEILHARTSRH